MDDRKLDITLLCGGISAEREVSLMTGTQIAEALRTVGHRVWQSDISPDEFGGAGSPAVRSGVPGVAWGVWRGWAVAADPRGAGGSVCGFGRGGEPAWDGQGGDESVPAGE